MLPYNGNRRRRKTNSNKNPKLYKPNIEYTEDGFVVTTLYLKSLGKEINRDHLLTYFSTFGNVQNVRIHKKPNCSFGFVTFAKAESAAKVLSKRVHKINGREIDVGMADSWHQEKPLELSNNHKGFATNSARSAVEIPIEFTNATGTYLLSLNDDCLYEIFSLKFVSLMDLCTVAETCRRLKGIADRIFTVSYKSCTFNGLNLKTIHEMRRFLINFGSSITELIIGPSYEIELACEGMSVRVLDLVIRHCSKTLKSLTLLDYDITEFATGKLRPMFNKLQELRIENGFIHGDGKQLFSNCAALVKLTVLNLENEDAGMIFENQFPKLELFKYQKDDDDYDDYNLELFVSRHKDLKAFSMKEFRDDCSSLLPVIADNCKNLEKLQITGHGEGRPYRYAIALQSLLTLTKLTKLKIKCEDLNVTKFIKQLPQLRALEHLELWHAVSDAEFIPALSKLKNLNVLRLCYCSDLKNLNSLADLEKLNELMIMLRSPTTDVVEIDIVNLIERLVNLKKLTIGLDTFKMDKMMYLKLVNVVRQRTGRLPTSLEIKTYRIEADVADLQLDGKNKKIVKLDTVSCYDSDNDSMDSSDFDPFFSDDDDDDDDDSSIDINFPAAFLLPFLHQQLFHHNFVNDAEGSDDDGDDEVEVW